MQEETKEVREQNKTKFSFGMNFYWTNVNFGEANLTRLVKYINTSLAYLPARHVSRVTFRDTAPHSIEPCRALSQREVTQTHAARCQVTSRRNSFVTVVTSSQTLHYIRISNGK